jgi:hypothetical protein
MVIPGVSDTDLEHLHWNYGGSKGALGLRHVPSGITVSRHCLKTAVAGSWTGCETSEIDSGAEGDPRSGRVARSGNPCHNRV